MESTAFAELHLISIVTHHMNWGWGGDYNGYYYDSKIFIPRNDGVTNFDIDRKDILIND